MQEISEETLVLLSHATQERIRDVVEKLTEISQHRTEVLKVSQSSILLGGIIVYYCKFCPFKSPHSSLIIAG